MNGFTGSLALKGKERNSKKGYYCAQPQQTQVIKSANHNANQSHRRHDWFCF